MNKEKRFLETKDIALIALFVAVIIVCTLISIPIGPVPFTLQTLAVMTTAGILGAKRGTLSVAVYILLGIIGLPVFSGFKGGIAVIAGPTGGFIIGFLFTAIIVGLATSVVKSEKKIDEIVASVISMLIGDIVCFAIGATWFVVVTGSTFSKAMTLCILPFIIPDIAKIIISTILVVAIKKRVKNI